MNEEINYRDKRYRDDTVFQKIAKKYLTLSEEDVKVSNEHLKMIENSFIPLLKEDELFAALFSRIMYGGSFYKKTRYGKPEEFDLDFIIKLPINYRNIRVDTNHDNYGFVKIKVLTNGSGTPLWNKHAKVLSKWITEDGYLDQNKFRAWMESVFTSAFSKLNKTPDGYENLHWGSYKISHKKSGPAFTIIITTPQGNKLDVDLVPCLEFDNVPLGNGYRKFNGNRKNWLVVGKPLPGTNSNVLWRLCFYEHEKEFLKGDLKPVIRMMKKFRDTLNWKNIASYYIETIFYHELDAHKHDLENFLKAPKTFLFMTALKKLLHYLEEKQLPYYWHSKLNLFSKMNPSELQDNAGRLKRLIKKIDDNILEDRYVLANVVLTPFEASAIKIESKEVSLPEEVSVPEEVSSNGRSCVIL